MLIRQAAFEGSPKYLLKGGLHCHTTRSDGKTTPADTIRQHARDGYDFLALTDHRYYNYADYAPDANVLIMPGMELDATLTNTKGMCFHTVAIGQDEDKNGYRQDDRFDSFKVSDQSEFQPTVDEILSRGNLAFYCHPEWSCTPARSFENLKGYFAMELWNSGCAILDGLDTDNGMIWDEILMQGKRIYGVAVDDGHDATQHCLGWVRVNAEKTRASVFEALKNGAFYSSCGPEIYDFYIEDGVAHLKCSPCAFIHFQGGWRPTRLVRNSEGLVTEAEAKMPECFFYVRATVEDAHGRRAWTNPIFLK